MAIQSYFFLGTEADAEANEATEDRAEFFRVMSTNVQALYQIVKEEKCPSFELVGNNDDYTVITQRVPAELIDVLKNLKNESFEAVLKKWMAHEDAPYDNEKDHRDLLQSLVSLAKRAEATQALYLWNAM